MKDEEEETRQFCKIQIKYLMMMAAAEVSLMYSEVDDMVGFCSVKEQQEYPHKRRKLFENKIDEMLEHEWEKAEK